jgi:uracil-DNA glycosylase
MQLRIQKLDALKQLIVDRAICSELAAHATHLVFGSGNPCAELAFIGEAPGKKEDELGEPFVGASGKLLDEMLASVAYSRRDVYITNIVKYRPPNNRDPSLREKHDFLPYLHQQLAIIQPKLIVTLGRHSMDCFLPGLKISQVHGRLQKSSTQRSEANSGNIPYHILPLYHPAAALYNSGLRQTLFDDFASIPKLLQRIK